MRITVEYFAQARAAVRRPRESVELPEGADTSALMQLLAHAHGPPLAGLLLTPEGSRAPGVLLAVGDRQVGPYETLPLRDGDAVLILPAVSGGSW